MPDGRAGPDIRGDWAHVEEGCTLVVLGVMSEWERLKSGEASKEPLSSPELDLRMGLCFKDEG